MGAVGLAVIDPHFVRESNIEDCVIEAVGQVKTLVCSVEKRLKILSHGRLDPLKVAIDLMTVSQASM